MSTRSLKIDFVSDVVCPWCAIGLESLQAAAQRLAPDIALDIRFQPFELNPDMPPEGEDIVEHLQRKYGSTPAQLAAAQEGIRQRAEALGFEFNVQARTRTYNTFDAHRLLHWAHTQACQLALKKALLKAYFTDGQNPSDPDVLVALAQSVGLDGERARAILQSDEFAEEVRSDERFYQQHGIRSVPAIIIDQKHLISGGQPPEVFEQALRQIAQQG